MRRLMLVPLVLTPIVLALTLPAGDAELEAVPREVVALPRARVTADSRRGELAIELAPVDLPAGAGHGAHRQPPVALAELPVDGAAYGLRVEVVDADGRALPPELVHHFNLIDPGRRELFLPISRRLAAAGKETGSVRVPPWLFGLTLDRGRPIVANVMLHNPTGQSYRGVRARLVLQYTPAGRPWPLYRTHPFQVDVAFPVGDKSFDLPPGRSSKSWEGSPAVPGTIVAVGGHLHEHGVRLELADATTGELIWSAAPITDATGRVIGVPLGRLFGLTRLGSRIVPEHRYRVTVFYDNPIGRVIEDGGMGVIAALFVPDRGVTWPAADTTNHLYRQDLRHALRQLTGPPVAAPHSHH